MSGCERGQEFPGKGPGEEGGSVSAPEKPCECGCGEQIVRPAKVSDRRWALRRYLDVTHRRRAERRRERSTATDGKRQGPKVVPSRDRKPKAPPEERPPVFAGLAPVQPWRPPAPTPKVVERTAPRPSFGLTRRSA